MQEKRIHQIFVVSVALKGAHALIEVAGGLALYLLSADTIANWLDEIDKHGPQTLSRTYHFTPEELERDEVAAVGPVSMGIIPACAAAAFVEIRRRGWHDREALKSLAAPVLAPLGALGFAVFLWVWTGTPMASYTTPKVDWHETTTPLAVPRMVVTVSKQALGLEGPPHPNVDLNMVIGILGTIFLIGGMVQMWRIRDRISVAACGSPRMS